MVLAFVVSTLVLVALPEFSVVMLVPLPGVIIAPLREDPLRHTNDFVNVTLTGTDAVHTILKAL